MTAVRGLVGLLDLLMGPAAMRVAGGRDHGVVLLYHRISPERDAVYPPLSPDDFDAHLEALSRYFDVLSGPEWVERYRSGRSLKRCCTITFDDGYRDFVEHALPRLRRRGLPSTHFLITECLAGGVEPWTLRARRLGVPQGFDALAAMPGPDRAKVLDGGGGMSGKDGGAEMLREADVPVLLESDVEVGSHTVSHAWLTRISDADLASELQTSRRRLSDLCGRDVTMVSYPQGLRDGRVLAAVAQAGYGAGFCVDQRAARSGGDPLDIPRFDLTDKPPGMVRLEVSGAIPALRRLRGRA